VTGSTWPARLAIPYRISEQIPRCLPQATRPGRQGSQDAGCGGVQQRGQVPGRAGHRGRAGDGFVFRIIVYQAGMISAIAGMAAGDDDRYQALVHRWGALPDRAAAVLA